MHSGTKFFENPVKIQWRVASIFLRTPFRSHLVTSFAPKCYTSLNFHRVLKEFRSGVHFWGGSLCCSSACFLQWFDEMGPKMLGSISDRFDMIFTRICETRSHATGSSQTWFCLHFYSWFLNFDEICRFLGTIFPCDAGSQRPNVCDAAIWAAMHAMRSRQHGMFPAIWALRCEAAMRIARFAIRDTR